MVIIIVITGLFFWHNQLLILQGYKDMPRYNRKHLSLSLSCSCSILFAQKKSNSEGYNKDKNTQSTMIVQKWWEERNNEERKEKS